MAASGGSGIAALLLLFLALCVDHGAASGAASYVTIRSDAIEMLFSSTAADLLVFKDIQLGEYDPASPNAITWFTNPVEPGVFPAFSFAPYARMNSKIRRTSNVRGIDSNGGLYAPAVSVGDAWLTLNVFHYAYSGEPNLQLDENNMVMDIASVTGAVALGITLHDFQRKIPGSWLMIKLRIKKPLENPAITVQSPGMMTRRVLLSDRLFFDHQASVNDDNSQMQTIVREQLAGDDTHFEFGFRVPVRVATSSMTHYFRFGSLAIIPSSVYYLAPPTTTLSSVTVDAGTFSSVAICLSGTNCLSQQGQVLVSLGNLVEYDPVADSDTAHTTAGFDGPQVDA
ncbi:hypothetical protein ATCC90586_011420 [Pythium insidiosum]|nr:hypothetical protein ATCC90586_011420 [Pythium insidiosum]